MSNSGFQLYWPREVQSSIRFARKSWRLLSGNCSAKHLHGVNDAIQPFHPLLPPSPPALNLSQHQSLFQWVSSSNQVAKVLEFQLQHQSFQWIFRVDFLWDGLVWSPCCPRDTQVFSRTTVQEHQFFSAQPSLWSNSHHFWRPGFSQVVWEKNSLHCGEEFGSGLRRGWESQRGQETWSKQGNFRYVYPVLRLSLYLHWTFR